MTSIASLLRELNALLHKLLLNSDLQHLLQLVVDRIDALVRFSLAVPEISR